MKVGDEKWIRNLYDHGEIYFNSIQQLRNGPDDGFRFDPYEGISSLKNTKAGSFYLESLDHTVNFLKMHLVETMPIVYGNVFCLFSISSNWWESPADFSIHEDLTKFGTHCLLIDANTLINGIEKELKKRKIEFDHDFVQYYDEYNHNGSVDLFMKREKYAYQKEFRFYARRDSTKALKIKIGSLKGRAELIKSSEIHSIGLSPKATAAI